MIRQLCDFTKNIKSNKNSESTWSNLGQGSPAGSTGSLGHVLGKSFWDWGRLSKEIKLSNGTKTWRPLVSYKNLIRYAVQWIGLHFNPIVCTSIRLSVVVKMGKCKQNIIF